MIYVELTSTKGDRADVNCPGSDCWGTRIPHLAGRGEFGESQKLFSETSHRTYTYIYHKNPPKVNIPHMDGMGLESVAQIAWDVRVTFLWNSLAPGNRRKSAESFDHKN